MPIDLDECFSYQTVQLVKIRDMRLGIPHLLFTVVILIYVFLGELHRTGHRLSITTTCILSRVLTYARPVHLIGRLLHAVQLIYNGGYLQRETAITGSGGPFFVVCDRARASVLHACVRRYARVLGAEGSHVCAAIIL